MCKLSINNHLLSIRVVFPAAFVIFTWFQRRHVHSYSTQKYSTWQQTNRQRQRCNFLYNIFNSHLMQHTSTVLPSMWASMWDSSPYAITYYDYKTHPLHKTQNPKHVLRIFQTTQDLELLMCSQQPVTGPYPGPRVLSLHFSDRNFVWILPVKMYSEVPPRWQNSVVSSTNTKWGSLFLLQNSKPGHVQIVPL